MNDLEKIEALAKAAIARGEEIGEESWYSEKEFVCNMLMHPDDAKFSAAANPTTILELVAEVRRLREENMLCRAAVEDAVDMVDVCASEHDDDASQGALRATKRVLSEAIGKACPRLMMERPEGQKLYGLHWRELREENEALREDAERYRWIRQGKPVWVKVPVKDKHVEYFIGHKPEPKFPECFDAAIDATREAQP
jgi:PAS domain-containing protein